MNELLGFTGDMKELVSAENRINEICAELRKWNLISYILLILSLIYLVGAYLIVQSGNPIPGFVVFFLSMLFGAIAGIIVYEKIPKLKGRLEEAYGK
jgi:Na+/H+ antiporter NhaC